MSKCPHTTGLSQYVLHYDRQLKASHTRRDIMVEVMERAETSGLPESEIAENFSAIMLAGFHTTQNALCAVIFFVLTHPEPHAKLVRELQGAFHSAEDISGDVVQQLPYLNAVITEALRLYPPVPLGGPRVSPGAYVDGVYIPAGVSFLTDRCTGVDPTNARRDLIYHRRRSAHHCSRCITTLNTSTNLMSLFPSDGQSTGPGTKRRLSSRSWWVVGPASQNTLPSR